MVGVETTLTQNRTATPSVEEILNEPDIKSFLEKNQNATERVRKAAIKLRENDDYSASLKKLHLAHAEKEIKVFISYKRKDEVAAQAIADVLRDNSAGKLKITYQAEFTKEIVGKAYRKHIFDKVRAANWFILLLPSPSADLDWPLFETGVFEAQLTSADRLICIHRPGGKPPSAIEGYDAVEATQAKVVEFLKMVFVEENPAPGFDPINPSVRSRVSSLASKILNAMADPQDTLDHEIFEPCIEIRLGSIPFVKAEDLDSATIVSANDKALDVFGFRDHRRTFGELREAIEERHGDSRWRGELFHVFHRIVNGRAFYPVQAIFQSPNGKMYRPVVHAIDREKSRGPIRTYHVTFAEEVTATDTTAMPGNLAKLATLLRFAFRFRWEVLEPFSRARLTDEDVARLDVSMTRLKVDWESRGAIDQKGIMGLFQESDAKRLQTMFGVWGQMRNATQTGKLDNAIAAKDTEQIRTILSDVLPNNQEFLQMAADRFAEMIGQAHRQPASHNH